MAPPPLGGLAAVLAAGTLSSLLGKVIYTIKAPGLDDKLHLFEKPYMSSLLMFVGMLLCLPASWAAQAAAAAFHARPHTGNDDPSSGAQEPLLPPVESRQSVGESAAAWWQRYEAILWPTLFDLTATVTMSAGLLYTTASVFQMVRGTGEAGLQLCTAILA